MSVRTGGCACRACQARVQRPLTLNTHLMSDQWPPPASKPGLLRGRVSAFKKKGSTSASQGHPVPNPRPVGLQGRPRPSSPLIARDDVQSGGYEIKSIHGTSAADAMESIGRSGSLKERVAALQGKGTFGSVPPPKPSTPSDNVQSREGERESPWTGGVSAANAVESIGHGGSLKERMTALQGKGAFGGPPPPIAPGPSIERPKRRRPPPVLGPMTSRDESKEAIAGVDASSREASRSLPPRVAASLSPERQGTASYEEDSLVQEGDGRDHGLEEEERQRRRVITARIAHLGSAKVSMGPPIVAPRPVIREYSPPP